MSNADRVSLAYRTESSFNEASTGGDLKTLRFVSETLGGNKRHARSADIRADRNVAGIVQTDEDAGGELRIELYPRGYDDFLAAALQSTWSSQTTVISTSTSVSYTHATRTFTLCSGSWSAAPAAGAIIRIAGFAAGNAVLNGFYEVESSTTTTIVVKQGTDTASGNVSAGDSVTILNLAAVANGTTQPSFFFEKAWLDLSNNFERISGSTANTLSLEVSRDGDAKVTGAIGFIAAIAATATATGGDGANTAAGTLEAYSGGGRDNVKLLEYEADLGFRSFSFSIDNGLRARKNVGQAAAASMGAGKCTVSGSVRIYNSATAKAIVDRWKAGTKTPLMLVMTDAAGNTDVVSIPYVTMDTAERPTQGENQDVFLTVNWMASIDPTLGYTIKWARYSA